MSTSALNSDPGLFFSTSKVPMAVLRADGVVECANHAFDAVFGSDGKATGASVVELFEEREGAGLRSALESVSEASPQSVRVAPRAGVDAGSAWFVQIEKSASGQLLATAMRAPKVSDEDQVKLAVFNRIIESGPVGYWATNAEGIYVANAGRAGERLGIAPGSMVGQDSKEMWKGSEAHEYAVRALAGEELHVVSGVPGIDAEVWYMPMYDAKGGFAGTVGFCLDVTAQKDAERELRKQLELVEQQNRTLEMFGNVLRNAPLLMWSCDEHGVSTTAEGKGLELMKMKPDEVLGQNLLQMYGDLPDIAGAIVRALGGEESRAMTNPLENVYFDAWFMPVRSRDGSVKGAMGLCIDASERVRGEIELREKLMLIERQSATIRALATPIIRIWDEVLCLPVIGTVDSARTADMMHALLEAIVRDQARYAIIDLTGVEVVDTSTADHLIQLFKAAKVLGVDGVLCGIRPAVAQTVVALGLELGSVKTMRTLRDALKWCIRARGVSQGPVVAPAQQRLAGTPANHNGLPQDFSFGLASGGEP